MVFTFYSMLPLVNNFCTIYLRFSPGSRSQVPELMWMQVYGTCLRQYVPTFDNFTIVLTSGSRPCSHTAVKTITNLQVPIRWWQKSSPDVLITVVIRPRCQLGRGTRLPIGGFSLSSGLGYFHCISTSLVEVFQFRYHSLRAVLVCSCSLFRRTHKTYSISWEGTVPFQFKLTGRTRSVLSLLYTAVFPESYS